MKYVSKKDNSIVLENVVFSADNKNVSFVLNNENKTLALSTFKKQYTQVKETEKKTTTEYAKELKKEMHDKIIAMLDNKNVHYIDYSTDKIRISQKSNKRSMHVYVTKNCVRIYLHKDNFDESALKNLILERDDLTAQYKTVYKLSFDNIDKFDLLLDDNTKSAETSEKSA